MRTKNSIKNIYISLITQVIISILGFVSRKVFFVNLGTEYMGVNGLLTNILSMLSLVEGGIGVSITYNLYKPLAENDTPKIISLVQLYKKIYGILAIGIFILGIALYPLLGLFMKGGTTIPFMGLVYFIFVLKNVISYLNAHKWSLINADQKGYVLAKYNLVFNIVTTISKIIILQITQNYILYLVIEMFIFLIQNIYNGSIVNKRYPYIKTKEKYTVEKEVKDNLVTNTKAMFLHNIGNYCVFGTDNLLIAGLINIETVGLYSSYTMIIGQLSSLLTPILNGIGASVGNLIATEGKDKNFEIFEVIYLISFWIYSLCSIILFNTIEPFITWWLAEGLLLDKLTLVVVLINFYLKGLRSPISIFKSKAGIFSQDKYIPLIEAAINLGTSLILVRYFGLAGIFMGTVISTISIPIWTQSKLVYNQVFNKSVVEYFRKYIFYVILTILAGLISTLTCNYLVKGVTIIDIIMKGIICLIIPNIIYILALYKTKEFKYILNIIKPIANKLTKILNTNLG